MTNKELKERLSPSLIDGIANILNDPTIVHKKDQIQGLLFNQLTGKYWDNVNDYAEAFPPNGVSGEIAEGMVCRNGCATHGAPILVVRAQLPADTCFKMGQKVKCLVYENNAEKIKNKK